MHMEEFALKFSLKLQLLKKIAERSDSCGRPCQKIKSLPNALGKNGYMQQEIDLSCVVEYLTALKWDLFLPVFYIFKPCCKYLIITSRL